MRNLTLKYEKLSEPLYNESSKIIQGLKAPSEEELKELDKFLNEEEKVKKDEIE